MMASASRAVYKPSDLLEPDWWLSLLLKPFEYPNFRSMKFGLVVTVEDWPSSRTDQDRRHQKQFFEDARVLAYWQ